MAARSCRLSQQVLDKNFATKRRKIVKVLHYAFYLMKMLRVDGANEFHSTFSFQSA